MISNKHVKKVYITEDMMTKAQNDALHLGSENRGKKTKYGGKDYDVKGSLGQQAIHLLLSKMNIPHTYSETYTEKQFGDYGDVKIFGETYDVKCRGNWDPRLAELGNQNFSSLNFLVGEHEKNNKTDHYIFTTIDRDMEYIYVLGAISKEDLFSSLKPIPSNVNLRFKSAGRIYAKDLYPLSNYIFRV